MILKIDFSADIPVYRQIRNEIVLGIADGRLKPGEKLPSLRTLAIETGINMMTADKAYRLLKQEGYIIIDRRSGATVSGGANDAVTLQTKNELRLLISQLKLTGVTKSEILNLCSELYDTMNKGEKE